MVGPSVGKIKKGESAVNDSFRKCQKNLTTRLTCSRICDILGQSDAP